MAGSSLRWRGALLGVILAVLPVVAVVAAVAAADAQARVYAPVGTPGPPLSVPAGMLLAALTCTSSVAQADRAPILLVPGTALNPTEFSWNWERALAAQNWPYCTIDLPGNGMGDIQTAGEYVVYAIRTMYSLAGRRIDIVGHSQGGMVPRWALRFWPDTRTMVDDVVGLAPSNHGTIDASAACLPGCAPAIWQQRPDAAFLRALNSHEETFPGISYTDVYTRTDEIVFPNLTSDESSSLHGGGGAIANVAIQQVCPLDLSEHFGVGTYDNTADAIAMDALTHAGPADPARVSTSVCLDPLMPGVDPLTFPVDFAQVAVVAATTIATYPHVTAEPPLAPYVIAKRPKGPRRNNRGLRWRLDARAATRRITTLIPARTLSGSGTAETEAARRVPRRYAEW